MPHGLRPGENHPDLSPFSESFPAVKTTKSAQCNSGLKIPQPPLGSEPGMPRIMVSFDKKCVQNAFMHVAKGYPRG